VNGDRSTHRETSDIDPAGVVRFAIGLIVAGIAIHVLVWYLLAYFSREAARPVPAEFPLATGTLRRLPPEPRLQTDPRSDLTQMRRDEDRILQSYGWIDRNAGIVRIPIDEAMKLTLQRKLPTRPAAPETRR
jgi:hypothetical protein